MGPVEVLWDRDVVPPPWKRPVEVLWDRDWVSPVLTDTHTCENIVKIKLCTPNHNNTPETIYETRLSICIQFSGHLPRYGEIRRFLYHQRIYKEKSYPFVISTGNKNEWNFLHSFFIENYFNGNWKYEKKCSQTHYNFTDIFAKGQKIWNPYWMQCTTQHNRFCHPKNLLNCNSCVTSYFLLCSYVTNYWIRIPSKLLLSQLSQLSPTCIATVVNFQYIETSSTIFDIQHAQYEHIKYRHQTSHLFQNYLLG